MKLGMNSIYALTDGGAEQQNSGLLSFCVSTSCYVTHACSHIRAERESPGERRPLNFLEKDSIGAVR